MQGFSGKARKRETTRKTNKSEDNIKIDVREIGCGFMEWVYVA
jgi:hypothetical protein